MQKKILEDARIGHLLDHCGESDSQQLAQMRLTMRAERQSFLENLPLPLLGAILSQCAISWATIAASPIRGGSGSLFASIWTDRSQGLEPGEPRSLRASEAQRATFGFGNSTVLARIDEFLDDGL